MRDAILTIVANLEEVLAECVGESRALSDSAPALLRNEKMSRGGGRRRLGERYAEQAQEYEVGYKTEHEDEKSAKGHRTKEEQSKEYDVEHGDASGRAVEDAFYSKGGAVARGEKGTKVSGTPTQVRLPVWGSCQKCCSTTTKGRTRKGTTSRGRT